MGIIENMFGLSKEGAAEPVISKAEVDNTAPDAEITESVAEIAEDDEEYESDDAVSERIDALQSAIDDIDMNVRQLVQNQASAADVAAMRRENEAFRADSNIKLMRAYGIDSMIKTYQAICDKMFSLNHPKGSDSPEDAEGERKAYVWVLEKMARQFKRLGIRLQSSMSGDEFDGESMVVYGSDGEDVDESLTLVQTEIADLRWTVKESVSPAFIWTIPSLIGEKKEWVMEPEKICMYK